MIGTDGLDGSRLLVIARQQRSADTTELVGGLLRSPTFLVATLMCMAGAAVVFAYSALLGTLV